MTANTALRLGRYFGTTPEFWMNLQRSYDLDVAAQHMGNALSRIPQRPVTSIARHRGRKSA